MISSFERGMSMAFWLANIVFLAVAIVLLLIFVTLPLNLAARMLYEDDELIKAFGTTILLIITYVGCLEIFSSWPIMGLLIAFIISLVLIKEIYDTTWGSAVMMWIVAIIMVIVITVVVAIALSVTLPFL
jgi:hypothetical protein